MDLSRFDLNLLLVFEAVARERSVTRAAKRLSLSQPALSHALKRLRDLVDDPLFVRRASGMTPTPRAEQLEPTVRRVLGELRAALQPATFDAASSRRTFRLAVNNYFAVVAAPRLVLDGLQHAPGVRLSLRPSGTLNIRELLAYDDLDLAVVASDLADDETFSELLLRDDYVAVVRRDHPVGGVCLSRETFAGLTRIGVTSTGDEADLIDQVFFRSGLHQAVGPDVPYLSLGRSLAGSDRMAVLARAYALALIGEHPLRLCELPVDVPELKLFMAWSRRLDADPAHRWLRKCVGAVTQACHGPGARAFGSGAPAHGEATDP